MTASSELVTLLPWATLVAIAALATYVVRISLAFGKTASEASSAKAKADAVEKDLASYKLEVAEKYVQAEAMREFRDELGGEIRRLGDRLDRVIEMAASRTSSRAGTK